MYLAIRHWSLITFITREIKNKNNGIEDVPWLYLTLDVGHTPKVRGKLNDPNAFFTLNTEINRSFYPIYRYIPATSSTTSVLRADSSIMEIYKLFCVVTKLRHTYSTWILPGILSCRAYNICNAIVLDTNNSRSIESWVRAPGGSDFDFICEIKKDSIVESALQRG